MHQSCPLPRPQAATATVTVVIGVEPTLVAAVMDQLHWSQGAFRYRLQAALAPVGVFLEGSVEVSVSKQRETAVGRHRHVGAQCGCARVFHSRVFFLFL